MMSRRVLSPIVRLLLMLVASYLLLESRTFEVADISRFLPLIAVVLGLDVLGVLLWDSGTRPSVPIGFALVALTEVQWAIAVHLLGALLALIADGIRSSKPKFSQAENAIEQGVSAVLAVGAAWFILSYANGPLGTLAAAAVYVATREASVLMAVRRDAHLDLGLVLMLLAAEVSAALLLLLLYPQLLVWGLVLVGIVLAVMQYSSGLLLRVREAYEAMLEGTVAAIEAGDECTAGHGLRVAGIAASMARLAGYRGRLLDTVSRAALLHDLVSLHSHTGDSGAFEKLESVQYFSDIVPVLRSLAGDTSVNLPCSEMAYIVFRAAALDVAAQSRVFDCAVAETFDPSTVDRSSIELVDETLQKLLVLPLGG